MSWRSATRSHMQPRPDAEPGQTAGSGAVAARFADWAGVDEPRGRPLLLRRATIRAYGVARLLRAAARHVFRPSWVRLSGVLLSTRAVPPPVRSMIYGERYERAEAEVLRLALRPGDVVLELGTGLGFLSTLALRLGARAVHTFDPNPAIAAIAEETFRKNRVAPTFHRCALGREDGRRVLHLGNVFWGASTTRTAWHTDSVDVEVRSFNDFVCATAPTLLLCDIEGGEVELVDYADLSSVERIAIELHPSHVGNDATLAFIDRLRDQGFVPNIAAIREQTWLFERHTGDRPAG